MTSSRWRTREYMHVFPNTSGKPRTSYPNRSNLDRFEDPVTGPVPWISATLLPSVRRQGPSSQFQGRAPMSGSAKACLVQFDFQDNPSRSGPEARSSGAHVILGIINR